MNQMLEDFIYRKVIRGLMLTSELGRRCVLGEASTGYNFDSMYANKTESNTLIGRLVDKILLNLPAVQATRARKENIIKVLTEEIQKSKGLGKVTRIMDIACG